MTVSRRPPDPVLTEDEPDYQRNGARDADDGRYDGRPADDAFALDVVFRLATQSVLADVHHLATRIGLLLLLRLLHRSGLYGLRCGF